MIYDVYNDFHKQKPCIAEPEWIKEFLKDIEIPKVTLSHTEPVTGPLTEKKIGDFIKSSSPGKAPGTSGITYGIYQFL